MRIAPIGIKPALASYDALVPLNGLASVTIPPRATEGFWLFVEVPRDVKPTTYKGALVIEEQFTFRSVQINVELEVSEVTLPESLPLVTFNWWGYGDAPDEWWDDLIRHGVNAVLCNVYPHVWYRFDEGGNLVGEVDFSRMRKHIEFVRRTNGWLLLEWYLHAPQFAALQCHVPNAPSGASLKFMSEPWKRAFATLLTRTMQHLESQGIPKERILHYIFDEYLGERFIQVAELIKSVNPQYHIFADGTFSLDEMKRALPLVDVWCIWFGAIDAMERDGRLDFLRKTGKPLWAYDPGYMQRAEDPYRKMRLKFWLALRFKLQGCTYWKHQGDNIGTAYYPSFGDAPITSRRMEAWLSGLQDYKLLKMVEGVAKGEGKFAKEAHALLSEAVQSVLADARNHLLAEQYRGHMIRFFEQSKK